MNNVFIHILFYIWGKEFIYIKAHLFLGPLGYFITVYILYLSIVIPYI